MADTKLFNIKGTVKEYQSGTVTLEKELQTVIENNMNIFFGVTFLASEYRTTDGGRMDSIAIDENLKDGDIIYLDDKLCVAVKLTSCPLIKINVHTMQEMGMLCFEIGNRHLSLKISDDNVLIPHDEPTEKRLKNLGFECENIIGRFDDFIVCKAHGHSHSHSHEHGEHHHHEHSH